MANSFLTPDIIARRALATLYENLVMLPLVYTDLSSEFTGQKVGDTISIRKPVVFEAKIFDRAAGIEIQDANEGRIPVTLDKIPDVSFAVTSEDLRLEIEDFNEQLLSPALMAMAQHIDRAILALRTDITQTAGFDADTAWDAPESLIEAGRILDTKNVPVDRQAVIGPTQKAKWLNKDLLKRADHSGTTGALRAGSVGADLFGFDVYQSQNVKDDIGIAFHESAFAFVSVPLTIPPGADAAVESYRGLSIRVASDYDISKKQSIISLDMLYGTKTIDPDRAVRLSAVDAS